MRSLKEVLKSGIFKKPINKEPTWCKYVKVNGNQYCFDIADDGITYNPLYGGDGTEKDVDCFLTWEEIVKIFKEEKQARN